MAYTYALTSPTPNGSVKFGEVAFQILDAVGRPTCVLSLNGDAVFIDGTVSLNPHASDINPLAGAISGSICQSFGFESIGAGPEFNNSVHLPFKSCEKNSSHFRVEIDKSQISAIDLSKRCGAVYLVTAYTQIYNDCGQPVSINGFSNVPVLIAVSQ